MKHMVLSKLYRVLNADLITAEGLASFVAVQLWVGSALIWTSRIMNNKKLFETYAWLSFHVRNTVMIEFTLCGKVLVYYVLVALYDMYLIR
jgi:hypothetical protein